MALWSGRFKEPLSEIALRFSSSIDLDRQLYQEDIAGSIAHVEMLAATRIILASDARRIRTALHQIKKEIETGKFQLSREKEDIHMAIEQRLLQKVGPVGGKIHTARSRNDQVGLDERLYLRTAIADISKLIDDLQGVLVIKAEKYFGLVIPGYTHMQRAQPVLFSHHLLAYVSMLERDRERLSDCLNRVNRLPLGAAALAGTSLPIDRSIVAKKLGFTAILENSIDAVSDRDYIIEFLATASIILMHLSRLGEELVLWSSQEFDFASTRDSYTTGSSIMPQKKNPDMAELMRGKSGRVFGSLMAMLTIMKGLPLAYNRDMQEDKGPLFDAVATLRQTLLIASHILVNTKFNKERFSKDMKTDFLVATDIAEYLVTKKIPFRESHSITGRLVAYCIEHKKPLNALTLKELHHFSKEFSEDIFSVLDPLKSVERKKSAGSTSPQEVKKQIIHWTKILKSKKRPMIRYFLTLIAICSIPLVLDAKTDSSSTEWIIKPVKVSFSPFQASLTEPRFGISKAVMTSDMKIDLGNSVDLIRLSIRRPGTSERLFAAGIDFFTYVRVTGWEGLRLQVDAVDGLFGGHLTHSIPIKRSELQLRFRFLHLSAHYLDGHFDQNAGQWKLNREPIPFTRDMADFTLALRHRDIRFYALVEHAFRIRPFNQRRTWYQAGAEWFFGHFSNQNLHPYLAQDIRLVGFESYKANSVTMIGLKWGEIYGSGINIYLRYYSGIGPYSEYLDSRINEWSFGFSIDYW